jgi:single-strand DNA-binding protein
VNFLQLAGHLGADPEVRYTSSGKKVTSLRLATKHRRGGNEETIWWRVTVWGEQFDKMMPYLKKGSPIIAMGEINKPEIYTDKNGQPQVAMGLTASNLLFSPFGKSDKNAEAQPMKQPSPAAASRSSENDLEAAFNTANTAQPNMGDFTDDEVPF